MEGEASESCDGIGLRAAGGSPVAGSYSLMRSRVWSLGEAKVSRRPRCPNTPQILWVADDSVKATDWRTDPDGTAGRARSRSEAHLAGRYDLPQGSEQSLRNTIRPCLGAGTADVAFRFAPGRSTAGRASGSGFPASAGAREQGMSGAGAFDARPGLKTLQLSSHVRRLWQRPSQQRSLPPPART